MFVFNSASRALVRWLGVAALVIAGLTGCTLKSGGYNTTSPPKIRFFNAAIDIGAVDLTVGTVPTVSLLNYEAVTNYASAPTGTQPVTITASGSTTTLLQTSTTFDNGQRFTEVLFGRPTAPQVLLVSDNVELSGGARYKLRLLNAATERGPLDAYVTSQGDSIDALAPTIANVGLGGASDFVELGAGVVEVRFALAGTKTVVYDSGSITLSERNAYSIVAYNRGDPALVNAALFTMDTLGSGSLENSTLAEGRVVNAAPGTPALNVALDGAPLVANVAYGTATPYALSPTGTHTATVQASATPATTFLTGAVTFAPGGDSTFVVFGAQGAQVGITLQDLNLLPATPGNARLRVVNVGSGVGTVNLFVNGALTVGGLVTAATSLYFELPPATYAMGFVDAASSASLLQIPAVALAANHTYTLFLTGSTGQLGYILTQDR